MNLYCVHKWSDSNFGGEVTWKRCSRCETTWYEGYEEPEVKIAYLKESSDDEVPKNGITPLDKIKELP